MARRAVAVLIAVFGAVSAACAAPATPGLVIDAASGKVLFAERATDPWYPASITKLMTTYVALDLVRQGKLSLNSLLTMTPDAAAMPPSKMGFTPGTQITLDNALKIIMVKSANDIAAMIGENLGDGSIDRFAVMMNDAAQRLGMRSSHWVNANGLPDERQYTTARDMAILARALIREFPDEADLFRIGALKLGRQIIRNHNGLLGRYEGIDGMKTGFICAGGFNIVATSTQNGRRLIAVVFGYPSAHERDLRTANLLDQGFGTLGWGAQDVESLPPSSAMSPPDMRPFVCGPHRRQPEEDDETAIVAANGQPMGGAGQDNPLAALFSPLSFVAGAAAGTPRLGGRRELGPRVAFEPVPIWLGPSPGGAPDEGDKIAATKVAIAARPVRTRAVGRSGRPGAVAAETLPAPTVAAIGPGPGEVVETLKTTARPGGRAALAGNLDAKPAAETKPRLGAVGSGTSGRAKLGAISQKANLPADATTSAAATANKSKPTYAAAAKPRARRKPKVHASTPAQAAPAAPAAQ